MAYTLLPSDVDPDFSTKLSAASKHERFVFEKLINPDNHQRYIRAMKDYIQDMRNTYTKNNDDTLKQKSIARFIWFQQLGSDKGGGYKNGDENGIITKDEFNKIYNIAKKEYDVEQRVKPCKSYGCVTFGGSRRHHKSKQSKKRNRKSKATRRRI